MFSYMSRFNGVAQEEDKPATDQLLGSRYRSDVLATASGSGSPIYRGQNENTTLGSEMIEKRVYERGEGNHGED